MISIKDNILLPSGSRMPIVGLGTWGLVGDELKASLETAFEVGYRHIDTAYMHFNEDVIGSVVRDWLENKRFRRKDLFITSKLPPTGMHPDKVKHFCQLSLQKLGLSYLDLYSIQLPVGIKYRNDEDIMVYNPDGSLATDCVADLETIWKEMENLVEHGLVHNIGVSNFNIPQMERLLEAATIKPANLQIEVNGYFQQKEIRMFCREHGITVTAYCPLGSSGRDSMLLNHKDTAALKLLQDPIVSTMAEKCGKSPAQVLLRHAIQKHICVIPKSSDVSRIKENFDIFDFYFIPNEMRLLDTLDKGQFGRSFNYSFLGESFLAHDEFPFSPQTDESAANHH